MDYGPWTMDQKLTISLSNIGRRYNRDWIFRGVDYKFSTGETYAILGPNGSGKSTILQVVNGSLTPSEGKLDYQLNGANLEVENVFQHLSLAAPYLDVIEEFTLAEMIDFHFKFKAYRPGHNRQTVLDLLNLPGAKNKLIKYFSSGMKQRLKLALAFCADTAIMMLDEPTSNLDTQGVAWYRSLVAKYSEGRMLIICSNVEHEYDFCNHRLQITDYKKAKV